MISSGVCVTPSCSFCNDCIWGKGVFLDGGCVFLFHAAVYVVLLFFAPLLQLNRPRAVTGQQVPVGTRLVKNDREMDSPGALSPVTLCDCVISQTLLPLELTQQPIIQLKAALVKKRRNIFLI